ncbi:N-acetylgalactosamine-6-O-sulfatase [subsurface metagenome]
MVLNKFNSILRDQNELLENTLVIFMSDNGANNNGSNEHLRGYKGSLWEGGHRVPAIAFWKGRIEPGTSAELLLGMDIFPTFVALTGNKLPEDIKLDGIDFSSVLLERGPLPERMAFWRAGGKRSIRKGPWKLLVQNDSSYLFNLSDDPSEQMNLIHENTSLYDSLQNLLLDWEAEINTYTLNTH